jgi:hypothetical protein
VGSKNKSKISAIFSNLCRDFTNIKESIQQVNILDTILAKVII